MAPAPAHLLLVDDDRVDAIMFREALEQQGATNPLHVAGSGVEALELLRGTRSRPPLPQPCIVVTDLNMPQMGGIEFVRELRRDQRLRWTVVFVLTTSAAQQDLHAAYDLGIAGYVVKSGRRHAMADLAMMLDLFARVVLLPGATPPARTDP